MTASRFFSFLLLCVIASLVWWLEDIVSTSHNESLREKNNRPDFYMETFTLHNYEVDGSLRYRASGRSMIRYPVDDSLEIEQLDMRAFKPDKAPMDVKADNALISNQGDDVLLTGNVDINQEKHGNDDSLSVKTEKLFFDNQRDYLETNKAITIRTSKHQMSGIGMQAWLEHKKYRLFSEVKGRHEP